MSLRSYISHELHLYFLLQKNKHASTKAFQQKEERACAMCASITETVIFVMQ